MPFVSKRLVISTAFALITPLTLVAQQTDQIEPLKLMAPGIGWRSTGDRLFWTTDDGATGKNVTPRLNHKQQRISSVFFLNTSPGWVLLHGSDRRDVVADDTCFELAVTTDGGENWSITHEKIAEPLSREQLEDEPGFSGGTWLEFVDEQHGWQLLSITTNAANLRNGEMFRTADGGKTWTPTKESPTANQFHFIDASGWVDRQLRRADFLRYS